MQPSREPTGGLASEPPVILTTPIRLIAERILAVCDAIPISDKGIGFRVKVG
jgi:hypothetical protein